MKKFGVHFAVFGFTEVAKIGKYLHFRLSAGDVVFSDCCDVSKTRKSKIILREVSVLKELCHDDFQLFGSNCPQLKLSIFVVHKMLIEHEEEDIQVNFKREIN